MKKFLREVYLLLVMGILLGSICFASEDFIKVDKIGDFKLEIGAVLPQRFLDKNRSSQKLTISSTQTAPGYNIKSNGIKYKISVDESNAISFIYSDDPEFMTPEKICSGMKFMDAYKSAPQTSVVLERGWIGYIPYQSGWNAAVLLDSRGQWSYFDKIAFVFKRK